MADKTINFSLKVNGVSQATSEFEDLDNVLNDVGVSANELNKGLSTTTTEALDSAKSVKELRLAIKDATSLQLSGLLSESDTKKISSAIGAAKDRMKDLTEEADALAGTRMEIFTNSLNRVKDAIFNLDLDKLKSGLNGLKVALFGNATGWKAVGAAMKAAGIGLLISGIALLWENMDKVVLVLKKWIPGFEAIQKTVSSLINTVTDFIGFTSEAQRASDELAATEEKNAKARQEREAKTHQFWKSLAGQKALAEKTAEDNKIKLMEEGQAKELAIEAQRFKDQIDKYNTDFIELRMKAIRDVDARKAYNSMIESDLEIHNENIKEINDKYYIEQDSNKEKEITTLESHQIKKFEVVMNGETKLLEIKKLIANGEVELRKQTDQKLIDSNREAYIAKKEIAAAEFGLAIQAGQLLQEMAGKNKDIAIAGIVIEKAGAIGSIISNTAIANAKAIAAFPELFGQPWVAINTASAVLSTLTVAAGAANAISEINSASGSGGNSSAGNQAIYADGGLLSGPSHSMGGIQTRFGELEGGEFVMNRRSTLAFLPLLSSLNELGKGVSQINNNNISSAPIIVKSYVVSSEMTSRQEADKKLRNAASL